MFNIDRVNDLMTLNFSNLQAQMIEFGETRVELHDGPISCIRVTHVNEKPYILAMSLKALHILDFDKHF